MLRESGINARGVKAAFVVDEDSLLVTCSASMLLFDIRSAGLLSSVEYNKDITKNIDEFCVEGTILVKSNNRPPFLEVYKIKRREADVSFDSLGVIYLATAHQLFHSIRELIGLKMISENIYEVQLIINSMTSTESAVTNISIFSVKFELIQQPETQEQEIRLISSSVDYTNRKLAVGCRSYFKCGQWNHIIQEGNDILVAQTDSKSGLSSVYNLQDLNYTLLRGNTISKVDICKGSVYLNLISGARRILKLMEYRFRFDSGRMDLPELKASVVVDRYSRVYFDEVTDLLRIFVLTREEGPLGSMGMELKVLDGELKETEKCFINNLDQVLSFKVIDRDLIHVIGTKFHVGCSESVVYESMNLDEHKKVSLILNLAQMTVKKLVDDEGGSLFSFPHMLGGNKYLGFSKYFRSFEEYQSDGIYVSKNA